jgi:choline transport protein
MALIALYHRDLVIKAWMTFVVYQVLNLATASIVLWGNRAIPGLNRFSREFCVPNSSGTVLMNCLVFYLQIAWFVIMITVAATAPSHRDSEFVFRTWINKTGWESNVICFITGLVNPLYSLGGLDGISHITEEMPNVWPSPFYIPAQS